MAGLKTIFICSECGSTSNKWLGRCPACNEWNTYLEEVVEPAKKKDSAAALHKPVSSVALNAIDNDSEVRVQTQIPELDRVLGGGIVAGSVVLIGGEPGAGKSTLLLQMCGKLSEKTTVHYVSGEESARQIKLRADRLGITTANIHIIGETDIEKILHHVRQQRPALVVIDSIQTMTDENLSSSAGSVTQVRECTARLMQFAKQEEIPVFIVGHVNKDGAIAGPKVMEHIVDTVLYFEGERYLAYRILRAAKNRYGSTNEIGFFTMTGEGLIGVDNPSAALLSGRDTDVSGSCVTCLIEGTRPLLAEIQSLASKTGFGTPRRTVSGLDYNRTNLLLAVLEKRAGYFLSGLDVYSNVIGGLQISEPSADLAQAISLVSAVLDKAVPPHLIAFGELGLGGEVRQVSSPMERILEAQRFGFTTCVLPNACLDKIDAKKVNIKLIGVSSVREIAKLFPADTK